MKKIAIFLFCLISIQCLAQLPNSDNTKRFLNEFFAKETANGNLRYTLNLNASTIDQLVNSLGHRNTDSTYRDLNGQPVIFELTAQEKELVKSTWLAQKEKAWDSGILDNAAPYQGLGFPKNSSKEEQKKYIDSYQQKTVVSFSTPLFLRNNSICLFFYSITYDIVGGGGGELVVLKKNGEKWERFLIKTLSYH